MWKILVVFGYTQKLRVNVENLCGIWLYPKVVRLNCACDASSFAPPLTIHVVYFICLAFIGNKPNTNFFPPWSFKIAPSVGHSYINLWSTSKYMHSPERHSIPLLKLRILCSDGGDICSTNSLHSLYVFMHFRDMLF